MQKSVTLYLSPYLRLYVLAKLGDPKRAANDPDARELWHQLGRELGGRIISVENDYKERPSMSGLVVVHLQLRHNIQLGPGPSGRVYRFEEAARMLQRRFLNEMFNQVDWFRAVLHTSARQGLLFFRQQYSITEEDHAFGTAERLYQKHLNRHGRSRPYRRRTVRIPARSRS